MNKWINVILATDERIDDAIRCADSLKSVYGDNVPIAFASYGNIGMQEKVMKLSAGMYYFHAAPHAFLTAEDLQEWHCSEVLAKLQIARFAVDLGYDEIYLMHSDVIVHGDYRPEFNKAIGDNDKYSFAGMIFRSNGKSLAEIQAEFPSCWNIVLNDKNKMRFADIVMRFNPEYVRRIYGLFGGDDGVWNWYLKKYPLFCDIAYFDLSRDWHGFTGVQVGKLSDDDTGLVLNGTIEHRTRNSCPGGTVMTMRGAARNEILTRNRNRRVV